MSVQAGLGACSVLADLRRKRDEIDTAIRVIETLYGSIADEILGTPGSSPSPETSVNEPGAFLGLSIPDATRKLLESRKRTLTNAEVVAGLKAGGIAMNSVDPLNTVGSVLTRRFHAIGDIVRVDRGKWGLQEWYPHTSFRKKSPAPGSPIAETNASSSAASAWDDLPQGGPHEP